MNVRLQEKVQVRQKEPTGSPPARSPLQRSPRGAGPVSPPARENLSSPDPVRQSAAQPGFSFSQIAVHPPKGVVQAKLAIAEPGDEYEQEADRVSAHVMRMPEPRGQRACGCGDTCSTCRAGQPSQGGQRVQASSAALCNPARNAVPPVIGEVSRAPGQPLDAATRAFMESRFGHDFSRVRVHTGGSAAASARGVGARAYTYGGDVLFGAGQYSPATYEGRGLLAHELAHVVQQRASSPLNPALAGSGAAAETKAGRAAPVLAGQADVAVVRGRRASAIQFQRHADVGPAQPALIKDRTELTDRIENAYGGGSLDEVQWGALLSSAQTAHVNRDWATATSDYLTLYDDVAKLAQADLVVRWSPVINVVTGNQVTCNDAKPGLNFSLLDYSQWGDAAGTTDFVDEHGKFGVGLRPRGSVQPEVAIVLCRSAFTRNKDEALGTLRHEMIHAERLAKHASALQSARRGKSDPVPTSRAESEVLGYAEGFMTMFHLAHPAPSSADHRAFVELLGVVSPLKTGIIPWAEAGRSVRSEALGQLQEYYCHALDPDHREAFEEWVDYQINETRNKWIRPEPPYKDRPSPKDKSSPAHHSKPPATVSSPGSADEETKEQEQWARENFFNGLQNIISRKCKGLITPMAVQQSAGHGARRTRHT